MKTCPKCGNQYPADTKFCEKDGTDLSNLPLDQEKTTNDQAKAGKKSKNKKHKKAKIIIIILAIIAIILTILYLAGGNSTSQQNGADSATTQSGNDQMNVDKVPAMTVAYAHKKHPNDPNWNGAYQDAKSGNLPVKRVASTQLGGKTITPSNGGALYSLGKRGAVTVAQPSHPSTSPVTFYDPNGNSEQANVSDIKRSVNNDINIKHIISNNLPSEKEIANQAKGQADNLLQQFINQCQNGVNWIISQVK